MTYDEIVGHCEHLSYRDKFKLAQLLIQLARKEEENKNPEARIVNTVKDDTVEYVTERLLKSKPGKKAALIKFIGAMFQFKGGISEDDIVTLVTKLQKNKILKVEQNGKVVYFA